MSHYIVTGQVTISIQTTVRADSPEAARDAAELLGTPTAAELATEPDEGHWTATSGANYTLDSDVTILGVEAA